MLLVSAARNLFPIYSRNWGFPLIPSDPKSPSSAWWACVSPGTSSLSTSLSDQPLMPEKYAGEQALSLAPGWLLVLSDPGKSLSSIHGTQSFIISVQDTEIIKGTRMSSCSLPPATRQESHSDWSFRWLRWEGTAVMGMQN